MNYKFVNFFRLNKAVRDNERGKSESETLANDADRRLELMTKSHDEERTSMDARIKQLQAEIEKERDEQDKLREESRTARIEVEQTSGKVER